MNRLARGAARALLPAVSAAAVAVVAVVAVAAACGPPRAADVGIPDAAIADAPWEAAFDPSERTETVAGRTFRAAADPAAEQRFVPHPGARVELLVPRPDGRPPLVTVGETTSGPDATFTVGKAPPGVWAIRAHAEGLLGMLTGEGLRVPGAVLVDPGGERMCGLSQLRELTGSVVDRGSGAPVGGARVEAVAYGFHAKGTTATDGTFSFTVPAPGCVVSVLDPAWDVVRESVETPGTAPVQLRTARTDPLAGFVVSAEDGRPLEGAVVMSLDDPSQRTRSGPDGRFSLPLPRTGRIAAFGRGRAWKSYSLLQAGEQEIRLLATDGVRGRVVDSEGRPIAGARLFGVTTNRQGAVERVSGPLTGTDGSFDFSWMPKPLRGAKHAGAVVAWHRRRGVSQAVPFPAQGSAELRIGGRRSLSVKLTDDGGAAVPGALVSGSWGVAGLDDVPAGVLGIPLLRAVATSADGSAVVDGLPTSVVVQLRAVSWGVAITREIPAGEGDASADLRLPRGKTIAGRLADRHGRPPGTPGEVEARLLDQPGLTVVRSCATGPDGAFRFEDLPPGRYELRARAETWDLPTGGEAAAGSEDVSLLVERSARPSVRIHFDGEPEAAAREAVRVRLEDPADPNAPQRWVPSPPGADGRVVSLGGTRPGDWRVLGEAGPWRGAAGPVTLEDGDERVIDLHLVRTEMLRATVRAHDGAIVPGAPLVARPLDGAEGAVQSLYADDRGAFDCAGFSRGRWEFRVNPPGHAPLVRTVEFPSEAPVELRLPPCGDLVCRIPEEEAPEGAADGFVSLTDAAGQALFAWPEDGTQMRSRFRFVGRGLTVRILGVPVGKVRVTATLGGIHRPAKEIEVRPGEALPVDL